MSASPVPPATDSLTSHANPTAGYTIVRTAIVRFPGLSNGAFRTYVDLLSYDWKGDGCFPGLDTLAESQNSTPRAIQNHITELENLGLVVVTRRGQGKTNHYDMPDVKNWQPPEEQPQKDDRKKTSDQGRPENKFRSKPEDKFASKTEDKFVGSSTKAKDTKKEEDSAAAARAKPVQEPVQKAVESDEVLRLRNALSSVCQALSTRQTKAQEADLEKLRSTHSFSLDEFIYSMSVATNVYQDRAADTDIGSPWRYFRKILENELGGDGATPATVLHPLPDVTDPLVAEDGTPANEWEAIKQAIKPELPADNYPQWFAPTRLQGRDPDGTLVVGVPTDTHVHWLGSRLASHVQTAAREASVTLPWRFVVVPVQQSTAPPPRTLALSRRKRDYEAMPGHEWATLPYDEMQKAIHAIDPCPECQWLRPKHSAACSLGGAR